MKRSAVIALVGASLVSACGGRGVNQLPPTGTPSGTSRAQVAPVAFTMHWPAHALRRPQYVSPSTMSVIVEVNGDPTLTTIANNPSSSGGSSTVTFNAPVGSDDFIISLYDQPQVQGETSPVGSELGQVELVQTIAAGSTNTVAATVNGIVAKLAISALPNQPFVETSGTASAPQFAIVGQNAAQFSVSALDADGNAIVGPGIAPTLALAPSPNTTNMTVTPVSGSSSRFAVTPGTPNGTIKPVLLAQATDAMGDTASLNVPVSELGEIYVSYPSASGSKIAAYDTNGTAIALASNAFTGLQDPVAMAYDGASNQLLVADAGLGEVLAFDAQGNPIGGFTPVALAGVNGVTIDTFRDHIIATNATSGVITQINGQVTNDPAVISPFPITTGQGAVYFPNEAGSWNGDQVMIGDTSMTEFDIYTAYGAPTMNWPSSFSLFPVGTPSYVTTDGQALFATGVAAGKGTIWSIPVNSGTSTAVVDANNPQGIAYDPVSGEIFVVDQNANTIAGYTHTLAPDPAHTFVTPSSSGLTSPQGITIAY